MIRFRRKVTAAVAVAAGVAALGLAPPAAQAGGPLKIEAGFLSVGQNNAGRVTSLVDSRSGIDGKRPPADFPDNFSDDSAGDSQDPMRLDNCR